jgi:four helix bundle protein
MISSKQQAASGKQKKAVIAKFTDLKAWQEGHKLVLGVYVLTKNFPKDELSALTSQMRRAAVSVTSNIAEGFSRPTKADKLHFYAMAHGSLTELQNQLLIARDVNYVPGEDVGGLADQTVMVHKLLNGLMKALREGRGIKT